MPTTAGAGRLYLRNPKRPRRWPLWPTVWVALCPAAFAAPPAWVLSSRHGECVELAGVLAYKFPGLPPTDGPAALVDALRQRGVSAGLFRLHQDGHPAVLVEIPERAVTLLFVPRSTCAAVSHGPK